MQSWGLVATIDESPEVTTAFICHHLRLGADEIHIYLDYPEPKNQTLIQTFAPFSQVHITQTGDAYWRENGQSFWGQDQRLGERPTSHVARQAVNAQHAYRRAEVNWLLHCDGDEFLSFEKDKFLAELDGLAASTLSLNIPNGERAWSDASLSKDIFDGVVVLPFRPSDQRLKDMLASNIEFYAQGLLGYTAGKNLTRTGKDLFLGIHRPKVKQGGRPVNTPKVETQKSTSARVIHFDGFTPLHWITKLIRKTDNQNPDDALKQRIGSARLAQLEFVRPEVGLSPAQTRKKSAHAHELHDELRIFCGEREQLWRETSHLINMPIDVAESVKAILPDQTFDFSPLALDRWLESRHPEIVRLYK